MGGAEPPTAMFGIKSPSGDLKPNRYRETMKPVASSRTAGTVALRRTSVWALVNEPGFLKFQIFRFSILEFFFLGTYF